MWSFVNQILFETASALRTAEQEIARNPESRDAVEFKICPLYCDRHVSDSLVLSGALTPPLSEP